MYDREEHGGGERLADVVSRRRFGERRLDDPLERQVGEEPAAGGRAQPGVDELWDLRARVLELD